MEQFHGTTIISVRRRTPEGDQVAIGGDGQVTLGNIVIKGSARKVRRLHHGKVLAGFAGATADAFTLFERFEGKLKEHQKNMARACVELGKDWRTQGFLAWLMWMFVHLMSLISFRNRLLVLLNWTWSYFTFDKGRRYIIGKTREPVPVEATTEKAIV